MIMRCKITKIRMFWWNFFLKSRKTQTFLSSISLSRVGSSHLRACDQARSLGVGNRKRRSFFRPSKKYLLFR